MSPRIVERVGTKRVVGAGLTIAAIGLALLAMVPAENVSYWGDVAWRMIILAIGMALTMAPATESIMGSLPRAKAGVGSAVNDTTRQVGGALGVAIIGSVMASVYGSRIADTFSSAGLPQPAVDQAENGLGQALAIVGDPGVPADVGEQLAVAAKDAFVAGMHRGVLVGAVAVAIGAIVAFKWLPARASEPEPEPAPAATTGTVT